MFFLNVNILKQLQKLDEISAKVEKVKINIISNQQHSNIKITTQKIRVYWIYITEDPAQ